MPPGLDSYTIQARVLPVVAVCAPGLVLVACGLIAGVRLTVGSGLVIALGSALTGQLGRDRGKALEPRLWATWGGSPSLQRLRYREQLNVARVERLHRRVETVLDESMPSEADEQEDPTGTDDHYREVSARIRAITQDHDRFPLLFAENVNYGLRRNLLGLRRIGTAVAGVTLIAGGLLLWLTDETFPQRAAEFGPGIMVSVAMLIWWLVVVRPEWVRVPAEAYADQFVAAIDKLYDERATVRGSSV